MFSFFTEGSPSSFLTFTVCSLIIATVILLSTVAPSVVVNVVLFVQYTLKDPEEKAAPIWLIFYVYSAICIVIGFAKMNKRSTEAMAKKTEEK